MSKRKKWHNMSAQQRQNEVNRARRKGVRRAISEGRKIKLRKPLPGLPTHPLVDTSGLEKKEQDLQTAVALKETPAQTRKRKARERYIRETYGGGMEHLYTPQGQPRNPIDKDIAARDAQVRLSQLKVRLVGIAEELGLHVDDPTGEVLKRGEQPREIGKVAISFRKYGE